MMRANYRDRHRLQKIADDADQVELDAMRDGFSVLDGGIEDERIADAMDDFSPLGSDEEFWIQRDLSTDDAVEGIGAEIQRRVNLLGDAYPFVLEDNSLRYMGKKSLTYQFCLVTSVTTDFRSDPLTLLPRAFEQLSRFHTQSHFGRFAHSLHVGWPRQDEMPKNYQDLMAVVANQTGEWWWNPDSGLSDEDAQSVKDAGVDYLVWVASPDQQPGQLFITGQCACGNDWNTKFGDADYKKYSRWFNPVGWIQPPLQAFSTPYALVRGNLEDASRQAGLVYDRIRLTLLAENSHQELPEMLVDEMKRGIDLVLEAV